ncbi:hypothetical protein OXX59_010436, partial [Metschnikowia pulcherrima]
MAFFFVEAYHPYEVLRKNGADITFVSETGTFGWDEHSLSADFLQGEDREVYENAEHPFMQAIKIIKKPSEIDASEYDLFFAAGGHGCLFDFPTATCLQAIF